MIQVGLKPMYCWNVTQFTIGGDVSPDVTGKNEDS